MTKKYYDNDAYATEFDATVLSCTEEKKGYRVVLDGTLFFPEEGGQKADTGTIDGIAVSDVRIKDGEIYHFLPSPLEVGQTVHGKIDFDARYHKMQNHTGEHIVCGFFHALYGLDNVGFHLGSEDVTLDLSGELTREDLDRVEELANEVIYKNIEVIAKYPSAEELASLDYRSKLELTENVRIVTIPGVDICACCAPHVRRTGEVGIIKLLDFIRYKGGIRIHMQCGKAALLDYRKKYTEVAKSSALMSVKQGEIAEGVKNLLKANENLAASLRSAMSYIARKTAEALPSFERTLCLFETEFDMNFWREVAAIATEGRDGLIAVFMPKDEGVFAYTAISRDYDLKALSVSLNKILSGKGGGKDGMIQGSVTATKETIEQFFNDLA